MPPLLRMLERKFGPLPISCQARLAGTNAEQLQAWALNLLDTQRIKDVFI